MNLWACEPIRCGGGAQIWVASTEACSELAGVRNLAASSTRSTNANPNPCPLQPAFAFQSPVSTFPSWRAMNQSPPLAQTARGELFAASNSGQVGEPGYFHAPLSSLVFTLG
jgi:hypothetical protein